MAKTAPATVAVPTQTTLRIIRRQLVGIKKSVPRPRRFRSARRRRSSPDIKTGRTRVGSYCQNTPVHVACMPPNMHPTKAPTVIEPTYSSPGFAWLADVFMVASQSWRPKVGSLFSLQSGRLPPPRSRTSRSTRKPQKLRRDCRDKLSANSVTRNSSEPRSVQNANLYQRYSAEMTKTTSMIHFKAELLRPAKPAQGGS
jgi:hypothetical protein